MLILVPSFIIFCGCIYSLWIQEEQWIRSLNQHHPSYSLLPASEPCKRWSGLYYTHKHTHIGTDTRTQLRRGWPWPDPPADPQSVPQPHTMRDRGTPGGTGTHTLKDTHIHAHMGISHNVWCDGYLLRQYHVCGQCACGHGVCVSVCGAVPSAPSHWC